MSTLDPELAVALEKLAADGWLPISRETPEEARRNYRDLALLRRGDQDLPVASVHDDVVTDTSTGTEVDVAVRVYAPEHSRGVTVVWLHGGGWVVGDLDTADAAARRVCRHLGATVVSVDYRLAPEHPHPAPLQDAHTALRWAAAHVGGRLVVGGDSAGAGLAAGVALLARDWGPRLEAQLLLYPGLDPTMAHPSVVGNADGPFLTAADMRWFWARYLPDAATHTDPSVNLGEAAGLGEVADLAPAVVAVAEFDPLRDEGVAHAEAMAAAGVPVRLLHGEGLVHGFFGLGAASTAAREEGDRALDALADLLDLRDRPGVTDPARPTRRDRT